MERGRAMEELLLRIENENVIRHSLQVEAIMRRLAEYFREEVELWGITGLVHDIDVERIKNDSRPHGVFGGDILECLSFDPTIVYAVRAHTADSSLERRRKIDKALYCAGPMAHFIDCCGKLKGENEIESLDLNFVIEQYNNPDFMPNIDRKRIGTCTEMELSIEEFIELSLEAIKNIEKQQNNQNGILA